MAEEKENVISNENIEIAIKTLKDMAKNYPKSVIEDIDRLETNIRNFEGLKFTDVTTVINVIMTFLPTDDVLFISEIAEDIIKARISGVIKDFARNN